MISGHQEFGSDILRIGPQYKRVQFNNMLRRVLLKMVSKVFEKTTSTNETVLLLMDVGVVSESGCHISEGGNFCRRTRGSPPLKRGEMSGFVIWF